MTEPMAVDVPVKPAFSRTAAVDAVLDALTAAPKIAPTPAAPPAPAKPDVTAAPVAAAVSTVAATAGVPVPPAAVEAAASGTKRLTKKQLAVGAAVGSLIVGFGAMKLLFPPKDAPPAAVAKSSGDDRVVLKDEKPKVEAPKLQAEVPAVAPGTPLVPTAAPGALLPIPSGPSALPPPSVQPPDFSIPAPPPGVADVPLPGVKPVAPPKVTPEPAALTFAPTVPDPSKLPPPSVVPDAKPPVVTPVKEPDGLIPTGATAPAAPSAQPPIPAPPALSDPKFPPPPAGVEPKVPAPIDVTPKFPAAPPTTGGAPAVPPLPGAAPVVPEPPKLPAVPAVEPKMPAPADPLPKLPGTPEVKPPVVTPPPDLGMMPTVPPPKIDAPVTPKSFPDNPGGAITPKLITPVDVRPPAPSFDPPGTPGTFPKPVGAPEVKPTAPASAPKTTYDVDLYDPKLNDTYESISLEFYNDKRYAAALGAYNRNQPLQGGRLVSVPPIHVLNKMGAGSAPANAVRTTPPPASGGPNWEATPASRPGTQTRAYVVPQGGRTLRELAQQTLGNGNRWGEIYDLNPQVTNPGAVLPAGSEVRLPSDARLP